MKFPAGDPMGEISAVDSAKPFRTFLDLEESWLILLNRQDDTATWKLSRYNLKTEKQADKRFELDAQQLVNGYLVLITPDNKVRSVVAH